MTNDGAATLDNSSPLDRPTEFNLPLYTHNADLLVESHRRRQASKSFAGVIYSHQLRGAIRICVNNLC